MILSAGPEAPGDRPWPASLRRWRQTADPPPLGDPAVVRHAEQSLWLHRELPPAGTARTTAAVTAVYDQGSGALVRVVSRIRDARGGPLATATAGFFVIGAGGFGGDRASAPARLAPAGPPDHEIRSPVPADQALLYRLSGDRTRYTATRRSPNAPACPGRCCTGSARTATQGAPCCTRSPDRTRPGCVASTRASPPPCIPAIP